MNDELERVIKRHRTMGFVIVVQLTCSAVLFAFALWFLNKVYGMRDMSATGNGYGYGFLLLMFAIGLFGRSASQWRINSVLKEVELAMPPSTFQFAGVNVSDAATRG